MTTANLLRLDNVAIIVDDLKRAIAFYRELGLELEGEMHVQGAWVDRVVGLEDVQNEVAMMRTPDGHGRLELIRFTNPPAISSGLDAPVNALGIRRIMFAVRGIDEMVARLRKHGAELVGEMVRYEDAYQLCYLRGPDGVIIALAEELGKPSKDSGVPGPSLLRMDNVLIAVEDLETVKAFFIELGLRLENEPVVEGPVVDRLIGLQNTRATLALMRTPDGHGVIELDNFHSPPPVRHEPADAPVNSLGIRRVMFAVTGIDELIPRLQEHGAQLVGEVAQYEDSYRLCYLRGPEGIIVALAEQLR